MAAKKENIVRDIVGRPAKVGDVVAFALAGKGATGFASGTVSKVNKSGVQIERVRRGFGWCERDNCRTEDAEFRTYTNRAEFCFAIVEV